MKYRLVFLLFTLMACNDIKDCDLDEHREYAWVRFFDSNSNNARDTVRFNSVHSPQSPYILYDENDTITAPLILLLDPNAESVTYQFETDSFDYDLTIHYESEAFLYSVDCGASIKFENLNLSSTTFDTIVVRNPVLNNEVLINAEIYF